MQVMNKSQYQEFFSFGVLSGGAMANRGGYGAHGAPSPEHFQSVIHGPLAHP
jgi:hypothetical protein